MKKKTIQENSVKKTLDIPLNILQDRNVAILESITEYFVEEKKMKYSEVANLLNRDQRTIWTACNRAKKKRVSTINIKASFRKKR